MKYNNVINTLRCWCADMSKEWDMAVNALGTVSGVSPSTIESMLNEKSNNPGVVSLKKLCDGLDISPREFF